MSPGSKSAALGGDGALSLSHILPDIPCLYLCHLDEDLVSGQGKATSFSSSWKAAVDADSVAEDSQPGPASRCAPLVSAGLPRCHSLQSLAAFSSGPSPVSLIFNSIMTFNAISMPKKWLLLLSAF